MLPAFLITFREVIEASLIVATILGILIKLGHTKSIKTVWVATASAGILSIVLLGLGSLFGFEVQKIYSGRVEQAVEGVLMILSAVFITWAVFFLHTYFSQYKVRLLQKVRATVDKQEQRGLFLLVFTAVLREGIEIVLFLTTIYFSTEPFKIFSGFSLGLVGGLCISLTILTATLRMPIYYAFKTSSVLLVLFAAGLLSRGVQEFSELGLFPNLMKITLPIVPGNDTYIAEMIKTIFGITKHMDIAQITLYAGYVVFMYWYVFFKRSQKNKAS